jgi:sortase A
MKWLKRGNRLVTAALVITMIAAMTATAAAADYRFSTGDDTLDGFGRATGTDAAVTPDQMAENVRRNKDAALLPPPYGVFSGEIPTEPSSPYHSNPRESGFVSAGGGLPPIGDENDASGIQEAYAGWLPSTSRTVSQNTAPRYYADGSTGTLYVARTGKTVKVYEGEFPDNFKKGAGHVSSTSAWDGNCALAGHNRGSAAYFSFVKDLRIGDRLTYTTKYGTRTYEVYSKTQVGELDVSVLSWSAENVLTLITCVAGVPELRDCIRAREV